MLFHYQIRGYYLYSSPTDMRKGPDSLAGIVSNEFKKSPMQGDLFIFINRRRCQLKMLHWQGDGFAVFYKRLEKGTFELPQKEGQEIASALSSEQVLFLLQGIALKSIVKRPRYSQQFVDK
jgi:transposase